MTLNVLGPKSENRAFLLEVINLVLNDHVYWRRNFYPKDPPVVTFQEMQNVENTAFREKLVNELFHLLSDLKLDPPFFSPRYMAHMVSETAMPGLIAYIATMLYNPNNICADSSPVTTQYERKVSMQFSELYGYGEDSFGHLTSGGTVANYESLYFNKSIRTVLLSMKMFLTDKKITDVGPFNKSVYELLNISYNQYETFLNSFESICTKHNLSPKEAKNYSILFLGDIEFKNAVQKILNETFPEMVIVVPGTAHYSWSKGAKLIGLGSHQVLKVKIGKNLEVSLEDLKDKLSECLASKKMIIEMVSVFGSTEFGSLDPIPEIVKMRDDFVKSGLYFPIHVDAAFGGYLPTIVKSNTLIEKPIFKNLKYKSDALKETESITVDPHKLGFSPYGAGFFLFKYGYLKQFIEENAEYCFSKDDGDCFDIGKYILEGSRPGASAAAVYFNHLMMPLDYNGHGKILEKLCLETEYFYNGLMNIEHSKFKLIPVHQPDSCLVCFYIEDQNNKSLQRSNELAEYIYKEFGPKKIKSVQEIDYVVSKTLLSKNSLTTGVLNALKENDDLMLIRLVFMNQWHDHKDADGDTYLDAFLNKLIKKLDQYPRI